jgi:hypothetical protein
MQLRNIALLYCTAIYCISQAQGYEGKIQEIRRYDTSGDTKESFRTIWYCSADTEYQLKETERLDAQGIAYRAEDPAHIFDADMRNSLLMLGISSGMYKGYYLPLRSHDSEPKPIEAYLLYISVPLATYNLHLNFAGINRQYMFNYNLKPSKENKKKNAVLRIPSGNYRHPGDYLVTAEIDSMKIVLRARYNGNTLVATLRPKENLYKRMTRKWGYNTQPLINIHKQAATNEQNVIEK